MTVRILPFGDRALLAEVAGTDPEYQRAVANSEDVWAAAHH